MPSADSPHALTVETRGELDLVITRRFDAPRRLIWAAYTEPRHIQQWILGPDGWSMPVCEVDLRVGGHWKFGYRKADVPEMTLSGTYVEITPPSRLVSTERWGPEWPETRNTVELTEQSGVTTMTITVTYPDTAARDAALKTGMTGGMEMSYQKLERLLATLA